MYTATKPKVPESPSVEPDEAFRELHDALAGLAAERSGKLSSRQEELAVHDSKEPSAKQSRQEGVVATIELWNKGLSPEVRAAKYMKMKEVETSSGIKSSPFAMYRATNFLYWQDLSQDPRLETFGSPLTKTWLSGDCHCCNMGSIHNEDGEIIYGLNDFDESVVADYQLDMWRLAVSVLLAVNENGAGKPALTEAEQKDVIEALGKAYLEAIKHGKAEDRLKFTSANLNGRLQKFLQIVEDNKSYTKKKLLKKWTKHEKHFDLEGRAPKLAKCKGVEVTAFSSALSSFLSSHNHKHFEILDVAQRHLAGLGAYGLKRYYALVKFEGDLKILDVKLQPQPTPYHFLSISGRELYRKSYQNDAERYEQAGRALIGGADEFLGWLRIKAKDVPGLVGLVDGFYSVRELSPKKAAYPVLLPDATDEFQGLELTTKDAFLDLASQWGRILGASHVHAACTIEKIAQGTPSFSTEIEKLVNKSKEEAFLERLWKVAHGYSHQVAEDFQAFARCVS